MKKESEEKLTPKEKKELSEEVDMDEKIRRIEDALGIETDFGKLSIRTYTKPYREPSSLNWLMKLFLSPILIILFILSPIAKIDQERIGGRIDWLLKAALGVLVTFFVLLLFLMLTLQHFLLNLLTFLLFYAIQT